MIPDRLIDVISILSPTDSFFFQFIPSIIKMFSTLSFHPIIYKLMPNQETGELDIYGLSGICNSQFRMLTPSKPLVRFGINFLMEIGCKKNIGNILMIEGLN